MAVNIAYFLGEPQDSVKQILVDQRPGNPRRVKLTYTDGYGEAFTYTAQTDFTQQTLADNIRGEEEKIASIVFPSGITLDPSDGIFLYCDSIEYIKLEGEQYTVNYVQGQIQTWKIGVNPQGKTHMVVVYCNNGIIVVNGNSQGSGSGSQRTDYSVVMADGQGNYTIRWITAAITSSTLSSNLANGMTIDQVESMSFGKDCYFDTTSNIFMDCTSLTTVRFYGQTTSWVTDHALDIKLGIDQYGNTHMVVCYCENGVVVINSHSPSSGSTSGSSSGSGSGSSGSSSGPTPPQVIQVEYLYSSGSGPRVDTGIKITDNNFQIIADMQVMGAPTSNWARYFGTYTSESAAATRFIHYQTTANKYYFGYRRQANSQSTTTIDLSTRKIIRIQNLECAVISTSGATLQSIKISAPSGTEDTGTMVLFNSSANFRMYGFQIKHNNVLIMDLIPVKVEDVGKFYDNVSGQFFENLGTVPFTCGPEVGVLS